MSTLDANCGRLRGHWEAIHLNEKMGCSERQVISYYILRNQFATALGSNRTQVPTRNDGILQEGACLYTVRADTHRRPASSFAVIAQPIRSILSARDTANHSPPA